MMKKMIYNALFFTIVSNLSMAQTSFDKDLAKEFNAVYAKAGTIKIMDNKAVAAGTMNKVFHISLKDVGVFDGHICACNTVGFIITKNVFEKLFPGQTAMRNSMNIKISSYTQDVVDALEFITGNRLDGGKYKK